MQCAKLIKYMESKWELLSLGGSMCSESAFLLPVISKVIVLAS